MKLKHYESSYPQHKREHSAMLRSPQLFRLTGDGACAQYALARTSGSYSADRERLVAARYSDWLDERNVRLSPFAAVVELLGVEG